MLNDIIAFVCSLFDALPYEVKVGLVIFVVLLCLGYESKRKAEIEAEERAARRTARKSSSGSASKSSDDNDNGQQR